MSVQFFLEFLANGFIAKQVHVKSTFHVLFRLTRCILLRSIWGATLRDVPKGVIAERTYIMYVARLPYDSCLCWVAAVDGFM